MSLLDNLPHTGNIRRRVIVQDDYLGETETFPATSTNASVWVQPASQQEIDEFQRRDMRVTHKTYFSVDPTTYFGSAEENAGEYAIVPSDGPMSGQLLKVISHANATAGIGLGWKVMLDYEPMEDLT